MNIEKLTADLNDIENEFNEENKGGDFLCLNMFKLDNCTMPYENVINYFSIFNIKNEYKKTEINAEKIQISILNNLIFLLNLKKKFYDEEILKIILECINVSFKNKNETIENASEEKSLLIYKQHLLKNKYLFLKILRKIKSKNYYPDIKQCIKDVTRDVFSFNMSVYNGSLGFETILFLLYKLLNKNLKNDIRNFLLSFFLLSIMSRTNNSVDILYILEYFYKNNNFSLIIPNTSYLTPCEVSIYNNIIILKTNVKYFINLIDQTNLSYNCHNIIYIDENLISDNFYLYIYKTLLKQKKYHYIFNNKTFENLDFFNINMNYSKLKGSNINCEENLNVKIKKENTINVEHISDQKEHNLINKENINEKIKNGAIIEFPTEDIEIFSDSTYSVSDNEFDIKKINEQNSYYLNIDNNSNKKKKNYFYQYLIIELNQ
ncbi:conserved Plasmodium protein, unknown function [Plasmodium gallinaceum]|uniref:Uncharacterized protein n=1 Tax=Plasmodium gallinaceum TaxID=5849 RepID=A0A1J1GWU3_PLAGA|nr:conserved Plasmodium protein, unknown function [Plasmodium gallinaceum]CRG96727.1 conserved Plasmodium protein, unknown function [Plasmodium gallinaceum]